MKCLKISTNAENTPSFANGDANFAKNLTQSTLSFILKFVQLGKIYIKICSKYPKNRLFSPFFLFGFRKHFEVVGEGESAWFARLLSL